MVLWMVFAIPIILVFAGLGMAIKSPKNLIIGKIIFEFKEYERGVVYRFGKYHRMIGPGWKFIIPVIETFSKYDLRTEAIDVAPQEVITKDAVRLFVDAVIYLKVTNPVDAELKIEEDYRKAVEEHVKGRIRNVVGNLELQDLYAKISEINQRLKEETHELTKEWGVEIIVIEIQAISPPADVIDAMKAEEIALLYKNAAVQEAETTKIRIKALEEAAGGLSQSTLNYLYLKALKDIADGKSTKIVFPMELTKIAENLGFGKGISKSDVQELLSGILAKKA